MSIENNFINELKFDSIKENLKNFLSKNALIIILLILFISIGGVTMMFIKITKLNKIEKYNNRIYNLSILEKEKQIEGLEELYTEKSIPRISKTFTGLKLIDNYKTINNTKRIKEIYSEVYENEIDIFFKNYAGLNLLILELNEKDLNIEKIENLISKLTLTKNNPLINLILEQKIIFLIRQSKNEEAKNLINNLLDSSENNNFSIKLQQYLLIL